MAAANKQNLVYFEGSTMRQLYDSMVQWQEANNQRLLSISIQEEGNTYCCIALTNPTEVVITDLDGSHAGVWSGRLGVWS